MKKTLIFLLGALMALFLFVGTARAAKEVKIVGGGWIPAYEGDKVRVYSFAEVRNDLNYGTRLAFLFTLTSGGAGVSYKIVEKDKYGEPFFINAGETKDFYPTFVFPRTDFDKADNLGKMAVSPVGVPPMPKKVQGDEPLYDSPYFIDMPVHLILGAKEASGIVTRKVWTNCHVKNPFNSPVGVRLFVSIRSSETDEVLCQDRIQIYHDEIIEAGDSKYISIPSYFPDKYFGIGYIYIEIEEWNFCL